MGHYLNLSHTGHWWFVLIVRGKPPCICLVLCGNGLRDSPDKYACLVAGMLCGSSGRKASRWARKAFNRKRYAGREFGDSGDEDAEEIQTLKRSRKRKHEDKVSAELRFLDEIL